MHSALKLLVLDDITARADAHGAASSRGAAVTGREDVGLVLFTTGCRWGVFQLTDLIQDVVMVTDYFGCWGCLF